MLNKKILINVHYLGGHVAYNYYVKKQLDYIDIREWMKKIFILVIITSFKNMTLIKIRYLGNK